MEKIQEFASADRHLYDFGLCSYANGFSQIDTDQDAWYYGTWANPFKFIIFNYVEGDCYTTICENEEEFKNAMADMAKWNTENNYGFHIDPGGDPKNKEQWINVGLSEYLH